MEADRRLDVYAARQYGAFSLEQAREAGLTDRMVEGRLATGAWIRLDAGIYVLASSPPRWERQLSAAVLSRPGSVVAGRSAAYLHRMDGFKQGRPAVMIPFEGNARSPIARVIRTRHFATIATMRVGAFRVTTTEETMVSLAAEVKPDHLEAILDQCLAVGTFDAETLKAAVDRRRGARGLATLRRLADERLPHAYQPPTSELERMLYRLLEQTGIPPVSRQHPFPREVLPGTVDAFIPRWGLIVEADGRRWHTRKADFERDRIRDNMATVHDIAVLRFSYQMLAGQPDVCLRTVLEAGRSRARAS